MPESLGILFGYLSLGYWEEEGYNESSKFSSGSEIEIGGAWEYNWRGWGWHPLGVSSTGE